MCEDGQFTDRMEVRVLLQCREAVANYKESLAQDCASWSNQTVSIYRGGLFEQIPSTELNVGNGVRLAFAKDRFITESIKSGYSEVRVYDSPGLEFVSLPK